MNFNVDKNTWGLGFAFIKYRDYKHTPEGVVVSGKCVDAVLVFLCFELTIPIFRKKIKNAK